MGCLIPSPFFCCLKLIAEVNRLAKASSAEEFLLVRDIILRTMIAVYRFQALWKRSCSSCYFKGDFKFADCCLVGRKDCSHTHRWVSQLVLGRHDCKDWHAMPRSGGSMWLVRHEYDVVVIRFWQWLLAAELSTCNKSLARLQMRGIRPALRSSDSITHLPLLHDQIAKVSRRTQNLIGLILVVLSNLLLVPISGTPSYRSLASFSRYKILCSKCTPKWKSLMLSCLACTFIEELCYVAALWTLRSFRILAGARLECPSKTMSF